MRFIFLLPFIFISANLHAFCTIKTSKGNAALRQNDPLFVILNLPGSCAQNALELKSAFLNQGLAVTPAMVANRGRHNPRLGSFSFFETVLGVLNQNKIDEGDLFFGHFTAADGDSLVLDQTPERGKLMIEAIAWDESKGLYNFYELIGNGSRGIWFYRGDSEDILNDNTYVYRTAPQGVSQFGNRLRCSACHASGGPIMKEMKAPHNDWWTKQRPLPLGPNSPSPEVSTQLVRLMDASDFSKAVVTGIDKLKKSANYQQLLRLRSLQERLRPLFCENEINLESDIASNDDKKDSVEIPSAFLLNPLLGDISVNVSRSEYLALVQRKRLRFPETSRSDADHAWLTPVKSHSDLQAIRSLVQNRSIDSRFALAVLSIDPEHPLFSRHRCELLSLVPNEVVNWENQFRAALRQSSLAAATELLRFLEDETLDELWMRKNAEERLRDLSPTRLFDDLLNLREQVRESEISQNPRGQILEPGFRVIFPERS